MTIRTLRRVSAVFAAAILTLAIAGPAFANGFSGTLRCPNPRQGLSFNTSIVGYAPGGAGYRYYGSTYQWYWTVRSGYYGGGAWMWDNDMGLDFPSNYC